VEAVVTVETVVAVLALEGMEMLAEAEEDSAIGELKEEDTVLEAVAEALADPLVEALADQIVGTAAIKEASEAARRRIVDLIATMTTFKKVAGMSSVKDGSDVA
jgi:hypothetical protein